ncbi:MAG: spore maturation protein [Eubacteriales bacterium]
MTFFTMLVPMLLAGIAVYATGKGIDFYAAFLKGAKEGLEVVFRILPPLVGLLTVISMVRASGALEVFSFLPLPSLLPSELLPLMLVRPLSGSAALGVGAELMEVYGVDSFLGRTAAVMLGSTETTFYTITLYFGACGISKTRYAIPVALCADLTGFLLATWSVNLFFGTS